MKKQRQSYDLDYKRRIVTEYLSGTIAADDLARREGLVRGQIYKWRVQLERRERMARIETIAETEGVSIEQARKIALQQVPGGRIKHEELEKEAGGSGLRYSFDVIGQHGEREVGVDARTAKVLENSAEGADRD